MTRLDKKGMTGLFIGAIIFLALVGGSFAIWPDVYTKGLPGLFSIGPKNCFQTPFDENCYCSEGEEQVEITYNLVKRYICENTQKIVDIDEDGWSEVALAYAQTGFDEINPDCTMRACDQGESWWEIENGVEVGNDFDRTIDIRCYEAITPSFGKIWAYATFDIVTGEFSSIDCQDYEEPTQTTYIQFHGGIIDDAGPLGIVTHKGSVQSECTDGGVISYTRNAWRYETENWSVETSAGIDCSITQDTGDTVSLTCDTNCPHTKKTYSVDLIQHLAPSVMNFDCVRDGSHGRVPNGNYWCEYGHYADPTKEKRILHCVDGERFEIMDGLSTCKAPFYGTSNLASITYTTLEDYYG